MSDTCLRCHHPFHPFMCKEKTLADTCNCTGDTELRAAKTSPGTKAPDEIVIVAFHADLRNASVYKHSQDPKRIGKMVEKALENGADIISIRRVFNKHPGKEPKSIDVVDADKEGLTS